MIIYGASRCAASPNHKLERRVWPSLRSLSQFSSHLGLSWGHLGPSGGGPRGSQRESRAVPRAVLGGLGRVASSKTRIMQHGVAIRYDLEPSWSFLGALLGRYWGHLDAILAPSCGHLGASWAILEPSWAI